MGNVIIINKFDQVVNGGLSLSDVTLNVQISGSGFSSPTFLDFHQGRIALAYVGIIFTEYGPGYLPEVLHRDRNRISFPYDTALIFLALVPGVNFLRSLCLVQGASTS